MSGASSAGPGPLHDHGGCPVEEHRKSSAITKESHGGKAQPLQPGTAPDGAQFDGVFWVIVELAMWIVPGLPPLFSMPPPRPARLPKITSRWNSADRTAGER